MTWAGSTMVWTGGIPRSHVIGQAHAAATGFRFAQVRDSHLGFDRPVNTNVTGTFQEALGHVTAVADKPAFLIHTGASRTFPQPNSSIPARSCCPSLNYRRIECQANTTFNGKSYLNRYGKRTLGDGWYSFDAQGIHFIALVNVVNLQGNGLGDLGQAQLEWLEKDVKGLSLSTPIVLFAHVPRWIVYQDWGWGTTDGAQALTYLKRFGSVTVLNGHIHQVMQKVEGHVAFHTARSTAFPQGVPGVAKGPGPIGPFL